MYLTEYTTTVEVSVQFSDPEQTVIEKCRTAPIGPYWERDEMTQPFSLADLVVLHRAISTCIRKEGVDVNLFAVGDDESPEDVPHAGLLLEDAEQLHDDLSTVLDQWGYSP